MRDKKPETKTSSFIRTLSYHDFLENNLHPTKEEVAEAKHKLCLFESQEWVSEVEYTKSMEEYGKQNEALATVCYNQQVDISKLQAKVREIEANELKAIKLAEKVVGENAKIKTEIEDLKLTCSKQIYWEQESKITALRERLEAIRQWREKYKDKPVGVWAMSELGVLLSPKELDLDQNLSSHQCWLTHSPLGCSWVDCQDCPMRELEYYGGLERKFKELDQKKVEPKSEGKK